MLVGPRFQVVGEPSYPRPVVTTFLIYQIISKAVYALLSSFDVPIPLFELVYMLSLTPNEILLSIFPSRVYHVSQCALVHMSCPHTVRCRTSELQKVLNADGRDGRLIVLASASLRLHPSTVVSNGNAHLVPFSQKSCHHRALD